MICQGRHVEAIHTLINMLSHLDNNYNVICMQTVVPQGTGRQLLSDTVDKNRFFVSIYEISNGHSP